MGFRRKLIQIGARRQGFGNRQAGWALLMVDLALSYGGERRDEVFDKLWVELAADVTETSLQRYRDGATTVMDLLLNLRREADTRENFLEAYLGWRSSLSRLWELTYFDFERGVPVMERFDVERRPTGNGPGS